MKEKEREQRDEGERGERKQNQKSSKMGVGIERIRGQGIGGI